MNKKINNIKHHCKGYFPHRKLIPIAYRNHKAKIGVLLLIINLFILNISIAQNKEFEKVNFPDQKSELKDAKKEIKAGNEYYIEDMRVGYKLALNHYLIAYNFNSESASLNFKIGKCFLFGSLYKTKALSFFEKALELNPKVDSEIFYMLGQANQISSNWKKAINNYKKYKQTISPIEAAIKMPIIDKKIKECQSGLKLSKNPERVFIDNAGDIINSKFPEYGAIISADESVMMFTSRRDNSTGGKIDGSIGEYFEDIYITNNVNGDWMPPVNMGKPVNTDSHDATVGLSPDGTKLIIYLGRKGNGDLYQCELKGTTWSKPKSIGKNINTDYHESSACFSADGKSLFFVSNNPEGSFGKHDIYISNWNNKKERWGLPKNLGPNVNTKYEEEAVFIHPDGKTLFFSSKGHSTMGGYDIFKSELKNGMWGEAINMGYPVNTPDDDVFFVMNAAGSRGYYSSFNSNGKGEKDIYVITFIGAEKPMVLNTEDNLIASIAAPIKEIIIEPVIKVNRNKVTILKGIITDADTKKPLEAIIEVINNEKNEIVATFVSNSSTGKYLISLPSGFNYGISVKTEGYLFHSENFIIPELAAFHEITKNIALDKIKVGSSIVLNNIFFDYGKSTLRSESDIELENLKKILTENPSIKVEISGHTDNKGSDSFNQKLSENRAKSVVTNLISKGIPANRMIYKGYGETNPIAPNDTDENRQLNRRTEFKITGL